jgi:hypothetical protein
MLCEKPPPAHWAENSHRRLPRLALSGLGSWASPSLANLGQVFGEHSAVLMQERDSAPRTRASQGHKGRVGHNGTDFRGLLCLVLGLGPHRAWHMAAGPVTPVFPLPALTSVLLDSTSVLPKRAA